MGLGMTICFVCGLFCLLGSEGLTLCLIITLLQLNVSTCVCALWAYKNWINTHPDPHHLDLAFLQYSLAEVESFYASSNIANRYR